MLKLFEKDGGMILEGGDDGAMMAWTKTENDAKREALASREFAARCATALGPSTEKCRNSVRDWDTAVADATLSSAGAVYQIVDPQIFRPGAHCSPARPAEWTAVARHRCDRWLAPPPVLPLSPCPARLRYALRIASSTSSLSASQLAPSTPADRTASRSSLAMHHLFDNPPCSPAFRPQYVLYPHHNPNSITNNSPNISNKMHHPLNNLPLHQFNFRCYPQ